MNGNLKLWPLAARRALKSVHVALGGIWLGAALVLVLLQIPSPDLVGEGLRGVTHVMTLIDDFVIIPSASAIVLTGLLYGVRTKWRFVVFDWVIVKWVGSLLFIAFGALFLGPWIESMDALTEQVGARAWQDEGYQSARMNVVVWGGVQTVALVGLVFVSIFKPWGHRLETRQR